MYQIIKNVIEEKRFNLAELLTKIDKLWVRGEISDDEKAELVMLAQTNADTESGVDIMAKLIEMDTRIAALEAKTDDADYPEYVSGRWYYNGDNVTFDGDAYTCTAPQGQACVWSPAEYPLYWEKTDRG